MILGSFSPRRREIFNFFSLDFRQIASTFDESTVPFTGDAPLYARTLAEKKGEELSTRFPEEIILTADTVVYYDNKVYNKPKDHAEAVRFLQELSGKWHHVYTGVAIKQGEDLYSDVAETRILFQTLDERQIEAYLSHGGHLDKAGGYAIQNCGSLIVEKIEGCYYNVMGLPITLTASLLKKVGINLWDYLKAF